MHSGGRDGSIKISKGTLVQEMLGRRSEWDTVGTQKAVVRYVEKLGEPWSGASEEGDIFPSDRVIAGRGTSRGKSSGQEESVH